MKQTLSNKINLFFVSYSAKGEGLRRRHFKTILINNRRMRSPVKNSKLTHFVLKKCFGQSAAAIW